jgi:hypothetical protein
MTTKFAEWDGTTWEKNARRAAGGLKAYPKTEAKKNCLTYSYMGNYCAGHGASGYYLGRV